VVSLRNVTNGNATSVTSPHDSTNPTPGTSTRSNVFSCVHSVHAVRPGSRVSKTNRPCGASAASTPVSVASHSWSVRKTCATLPVMNAKSTRSFGRLSRRRESNALDWPRTCRVRRPTRLPRARLRQPRCRDVRACTRTCLFRIRRQARCARGTRRATPRTHRGRFDRDRAGHRLPLACDWRRRDLARFNRMDCRRRPQRLRRFPNRKRVSHVNRK
jgi:hypothetical protein